MLETYRMIGQLDLAELNADAVFTNLPVTVGGNFHLIARKQISINKRDRKLFHSA